MTTTFFLVALAALLWMAIVAILPALRYGPHHLRRQFVPVRVKRPRR